MDRRNKYVFNLVVNERRLFAVRQSEGSSFQICGAATEKLPIFVRARGLTSKSSDDERKFRDGTYVRKVSRKYAG